MLKRVLLELDAAIASLPLETVPGSSSDLRFSRPGEAMHELLRGLPSGGIDAETFPAFADLCDACMARLGETAKYSSSVSFSLGKLVDGLRLVFDAAQTTGLYRLCVEEMAEHAAEGSGLKRPRPADEARPRVLGYWCFSAAITMRRLVEAGVRSLLFTSGTLSPLPSFAAELGITFAHRLENPHVINPQRQLMVGVFASGPSGQELCSTYKSRDSETTKAELGNALVNFARLVPQGLLVFFPSCAAVP